MRQSAGDSHFSLQPLIKFIPCKPNSLAKRCYRGGKHVHECEGGVEGRVGLGDTEILSLCLLLCPVTVSCINHLHRQAEKLNKKQQHQRKQYTIRMSMNIAMPTLSRLSSLGLALALHSPHKHKHNRSKSMPSTMPGQPILTDALVGEVERLEDCCSSSSCFGADWLSQAVEVVVNCNSNLSIIKIDMEGMGSKWMNAHLDDVLHLVEVCNLLRDTIAEIRKQHTCVEVAIRGLGSALSPSAHALDRARTSIATCLRKKDTHSQLEKCMSILRRMADKLNYEDRAGVEGAAININHAKAITIMVSSAIVTALSFKTSHMRMPSLPLPTHFTRLQHKLKEAFEMRKRSSSSRLLHELEVADKSLGNLNNLVNSNSKLHLPLHLSPATVALHDLDMVLPLFEHRINQLFKSLISARVALLNTLSSQ